VGQQNRDGGIGRVFSPDTFGVFVAQVPRDIISDAEQDAEQDVEIHKASTYLDSLIFRESKFDESIL
jgi:hypothetical protein